MQIAQIRNPLLESDSPLSGDIGGAPSNFSALFAVIVSILFVVATLLFFFYFLFGAIKWITSSGDAQKLEEARNAILQALIGLIVLFALFAILRVIETLFQVDLININLELIRLQ